MHVVVLGREAGDPSALEQSGDKERRVPLPAIIITNTSGHMGRAPVTCIPSFLFISLTSTILTEIECLLVGSCDIIFCAPGRHGTIHHPNALSFPQGS